MNYYNDDEFEAAIDDILGKLKNKMMRMERKRGITLLKWLFPWAEKYLTWEETFNPTKLKYYKRGEVVYANFGFNVGNELGGEHFAIVIENDNSNTNGNVVVVPLRSLETDEDINSIDEKYEVFLGYGIFKDEIEKSKKFILELESEISKCTNEINKEKLQNRLNSESRFLANLEKGSVAKLSQICSLSKLRIYKPKHTQDKFASFKLDTTQLDALDEKLFKLFSKNENNTVDKKAIRV